MDNLKEQIKKLEDANEYLENLDRVIQAGLKTSIKVLSNNGYNNIQIKPEHEKLVLDVLRNIAAEIQTSIEPLEKKLNTLDELLGD